ncbi:uncharacterized protein BX663DRAFT_507125 [Cokeromyces recurvatus]|uniref:uncharacterized protein n=1 Tax=Cokeromyces recurvatus TaxID=90255 RepID=UPI00221EFA04|nr:uncharacterized protein BX663DRAFT_507125 [Cokeromyces recurvatus]KAI7903625.1 hypothetical protein BX663DRAFT_507125 [Cokeromyces recurvatus]
MSGPLPSGKTSGEYNMNLQSSDTLDLSNPYIYPANPVSTANNDENDNSLQNNANQHSSYTSFNNTNKIDPELSKLKSLFWKGAGQLQSTIGSLTGLDSWQRSGQKTEEEASREYEEAEDRLKRGEPSRIHGEYDRLMGYVNYAVGHIAGDHEMQVKAAERREQGSSEINKSINDI